MSHDKTQTHSTGLQEKFIDATQQAKNYREQLAAYEASVGVTPDNDSKAMLEAIETAMNGVSSVLTLLGVPSLAPAKPVIAPQDAPSQAELVKLFRIRNIAFFDYMRSLNLDEDIEEVDAFAPNTRHLIATDELTVPYRRASVTLQRQLSSLDEQIKNALDAQRTWLDFMIESILPSFLLKLIDYLDFQALTQDNVNRLSEEFNGTNTDLQRMTEQFHQDWKEKFASPVPKDLKAGSSTTLSKLVYSLNHKILNEKFADYNRNKSVHNLTNMYRLVRQLQIQSIQSSEQISLEIRSAQLDGVIRQLSLLHPDMKQEFDHEENVLTQEMTLLAAYGQLPEIQTAELDIHNTKAKFIDDLFDKYRKFLTDRNQETFRDLYQHIHDHPNYGQMIIVKMTRNLLKNVYFDAYQAVRQHQIANIDETLCDKFIKKYEGLKYNNLVYEHLLKFVREPTSSQLMILEQIMYSVAGHEHYTDPNLSSAVDDFMQICNSISSVTMVEDQSSDNLSEISDEFRPSHDRSESIDELPVRMTEENQEDMPPLSMQNLHEQNVKLGMGHNSFFNQAHSQQVRTEAIQMLKAYFAYQT